MGFAERITGYITWSWWLIFLPMYGLYVGLGIVLGVIFIIGKFCK